MYLLYYLIVFISFLYFLFKYRSNLIASIIIFAFYSGLAAYPGKLIENPYKILLLVLTVYAAIRIGPFNTNSKSDRVTIIAFLLFSSSFFISAFTNQTNPILALSQFGKFLIPFLMFFIFSFIQKKNDLAYLKISELFILLLKLQIILSFVKLLTLGITETTVGSIAYVGGGIATLIPILGFILLWIYNNGNLRKNDWYFIIFLLFISFMSYKRAIWFMMPLTILLFTFYVPKKKLPSTVVWIIPLLPLLFYLGVRLNPTLNKEEKIWGSFDFEYVINYVERYNFGNAAKTGTEKKLGEGRGGATLLLLEKIASPSSWQSKDVFGYGLEAFVTTDYETFDQEKFGLNSRGAVTGIFNTYISFGFFGVFTFLLYVICLLNRIKIKRLRYVLFAIFIWEYFFYIGTIFTTQALTILFMYILIYLNKYQSISSLLRLVPKTIPIKQ